MSPLLGVGLDLVDVKRIRGALERHGARFLDRIAGAGEGRLARSTGDSPAPDLLATAFVEHVAGLFAAKEAVLKALGTGAAEGLAFRDVVVESTPSGRPTIRLQGGAARRAQELGVERVLLSITHERGYAAAVAVLERH